MINKKNICLIIGPILFGILYFLLPKNIFPTSEARAAVGTLAWMAFWWVTSPIDAAVVGFLPIGLNAIFEMTKMSDVISSYSSETILLLLGSMLLTISWEETGLDNRIAIKFMSLVGNNFKKQIVFWFCISAFLSAFIPNVVVCATIIPIAVSMLRYVGEGDISKSKVGSLLLLTIVYAVGIGGLASPLGGAMNLITVNYLEQLTSQEYMLSAWILRFAPIMLVLLVSNILFLLVISRKCKLKSQTKEYFAEQYKTLPQITREEILSLIIFLISVILAFTRQLYQEILPGLKPAYVFIIAAIIMFLINKKDGTRVMKWKSVQQKLHLDLLYVFAGGIALGTLINNTGAAANIGDLAIKLNIDGGFGTVFIIVLFTVLLSDITSNTATAAVAIPLVISIIQGIGKNPIPYIYIATIGINVSYMLPTSIRAIPVGYGLEPKYMLKKGIPLTIIVIMLMTIVSYLLMEFWPLFSTTI